MPAISPRSIAHLVLLCGVFLLVRSNRYTLLHPLFSSNAVLQRDRVVPIWGEAPPDTEVEIRLDDEKIAVRADAKGHWNAKIGPHKAGLGHKLVVSSLSGTVTRYNIAFGDVWICSGQSNMEWRLSDGAPRPVENAEVEAKNADFPAIRFLTVPHVSLFTPHKALRANWQVCNPETVKYFSAVGYFFGREVHKNTGVPIGLVCAAWSGTPAEVWASLQAMEAKPDFKSSVDALKRTRRDVSFNSQLDDYLQNVQHRLGYDWQKADLDDSKWKTARLPGYLEKSGDKELEAFDGIIWYRREVVLSEADVERGNVTAHLGQIDDFDTTYWNGNEVGKSYGWVTSRQYKIPDSQLKVGKNIIAVRVFDQSALGGFVKPSKPMQLTFAGGKKLSLAGNWKVKVAGKLGDLPLPPVNLHDVPSSPSLLFNGMISPLLPYGVKGAIWYQGESNAEKPRQYETLLPIIIGDWRSRFHSGDFPFYIVQLAGYMPRDQKPGQSIGGWPVFRESQQKIARKVKNSGLAIAIDIGEEGEIHPRKKLEVGQRLAALALKNEYDKDVVASGPTLKNVRTVGRTIVVELANTGGELKTKGDLRKAFIIAGKNRKWAWGHVISITNQSDSARVVLSAPEVAEPVAVRFDWANFPLGYLYNKAGLPAAPFRSDDW